MWYASSINGSKTSRSNRNGSISTIITHQPVDIAVGSVDWGSRLSGIIIIIIISKNSISMRVACLPVDIAVGSVDWRSRLHHPKLPLVDPVDRTLTSPDPPQC